MAISYTFHGPNRAREGSGHGADGLGPSIGNAVAVADGAASAALPATGWYRIKAIDASLLQYGAAVTNGDSGEVWDAGEKEARYLPAGIKIGVSAG
jgi:hypothetical protein